MKFLFVKGNTQALLLGFLNSSTIWSFALLQFLFDISKSFLSSLFVGRIVIGLYGQVVPKTVGMCFHHCIIDLNRMEPYACSIISQFIVEPNACSWTCIHFEQCTSTHYVRFSMPSIKLIFSVESRSCLDFHLMWKRVNWTQSSTSQFLSCTAKVEKVSSSTSSKFFTMRLEDVFSYLETEE